MISTFVLLFAVIFLVLVPYLLYVSYFIFKSNFQNGYDLYARMGLALDPLYRDLYIKHQNSRIWKYKIGSGFIILSQTIIALFLAILQEISPHSSLFNYTRPLGFINFGLIILFILYYFFIELQTPTTLKSLIRAIDDHHLAYKISDQQLPAINPVDTFFNKNLYRLHVTARSLYKTLASEFPNPHIIPAINYSLRDKARNQTFRENQILETLTGSTKAFYINQLKTDLKVTNLWVKRPKWELINIIGLPSMILAMIPLVGIAYSSELYEFKTFVNFGIVAIFFVLWGLSLNQVSILTPKTIDLILKRNGEEIDNLEFRKKIEKLINLIEEKFPYVDP